MASTIRPYDLYVRVLSGTPTAEVEPNNTTAESASRERLGERRHRRGRDVDFFAVHGQRRRHHLAILDADPERDAPEWNPRMALGPSTTSS